MLLKIASACRICRAIALQTPTLWTSITFFHRGGHNGGRLPQLLELYVSRSMSLPLRIRGTFSVCRQAESSLDVLMQHSNRWRQVEFHIPFSLLPKLNAVKGQISSLEALALHSEYHRGFNGFIVDCFESAPALKTLKLPSNLWDIFSFLGRR
jgi:hypothetical protein